MRGDPVKHECKHRRSAEDRKDTAPSRESVLDQIGKCVEASV